MEARASALGTEIQAYQASPSFAPSRGLAPKYCGDENFRLNGVAYPVCGRCRPGPSIKNGLLPAVARSLPRALADQRLEEPHAMHQPSDDAPYHDNTGLQPSGSSTSHQSRPRRSSSRLQDDTVDSASREQATEAASMLEKDTNTAFEPTWRRTRALWILSLYLPLLILPWTLTCIMTYRPVSAPSYFDHAGQRTARDFKINEGWQVAISVMNAIAAVLTIPVTSLLLAEAAVLWLQRGKHNVSAVSLAQFYDLADRAWTDARVLANEVFRRGKREGEIAGRNWFLLVAAILVGFCSIILPLQQLLVQMENIQAITCHNVPFSECYWPQMFRSVGADPQPGMMEVMPLFNVKEQVKARLGTDTSAQHQALLWTNSSQFAQSGAYEQVTPSDQILTYYGPAYSGPPLWISTIPNGTTTGVLREHAMRMNFSITCDSVPPGDFPADCSGSHPFTADYEWNENPQESDQSSFRLSVCVPGSYVTSPWSRSRDASTIEEEIYMGVLPIGAPKNASLTSSLLWEGTALVTHCRVNTTRGYFELGNNFNEMAPQPLLDRFPRAEEMVTFNDYGDADPLTYSGAPPYLGPVYDTPSHV